MFILKGAKKTIIKEDVNKIPKEDILQAKGLLSYFQNIPPNVLQSRLVTGWLRKRSKGKTKYFQNRWFILVSARQIRLDYELDEEILPEGSLPPWMELETIYYFDDNEILSESKALKDVPLKDCVGVIVKDMAKSKDKGFTFKIDMGDRIFHLNAETEFEKNLWINAIEMSKETSKQQARSRLGGLKKNIMLVEKIFREGGISKLQDKIVDDYLNLQAQYPVEDFDNLDEFLAQNEKLLEDLIWTLDACMAADPPRKEIIEEYFPVYHEKACQFPTIYYESNRTNLQNMDLIKILNWIYSYSSSLTLFGIRDERLGASAKTLSTLLTKKMLKTGATMVFNILLEIRDAPLKEPIDGVRQTTGPLDLFKILNETLESYKRCQHKEVAEKMLKIIKQEIFYFQNYLEILLKDIKFTVEKYIGLSNDTVQYVKNINDFIENAHLMTGLELADIETLMAKEDIVRKFVHIGNIAFEKLVDAAFWNLAGHFKVNFMDLNMEVVLSNILTHLSEIIGSLHKSYSLKVWKLCFEKVIILYIQCLLNSAGKLKIKTIGELADKLALERDICKATFKVGVSVMEACIKVINDILEFFETSAALTPMSILDLRKINGPGFNINQAKALLNLRVDITSSERSEALNECKQLLANYKDAPGTRDKSNSTSGSLFQRIEVEKQDGDEDYEKPKEEEEVIEEQKVEEVIQEVKKEEVNENKLGLKTLEGYLEKKSAGFTKAWEKRFFAIKNDRMYWYNHDRAREALNHLDLKGIRRCTPVKENKFELDADGKVYHLKAPSTENRDKWVQVINELVKDLNCTDPRQKYEHDVFKIIPGGSLFVDYEPEWKPNPDEVSVLKKLMDSKVLEPVQARRGTKVMKKPEPELEEKERRKSITLDDL